MKIDRFEFFDILLPSRKPFVTASSIIGDRELVIVKAVADDGAIGWGEVAADPDPGYAPETLGSARYVIRNYLAPALLGVDLDSPEDAESAWGGFVGNEMAKAGLELSLWDLFARSRGVSVASMLGATGSSVPVGVSIGIFETIDELLDEVAAALELGFQRVKVKICPGWDVEPLRAVRGRFGDIALQADANSSYSLDDIDHLTALDELGMTMLEQPLSHDDLVDHGRLQSKMKTPICLDESILCARHARVAIELGSARIVNIKLARVGGLAEARRIAEVCRHHGVACWCGSMLESGIGVAFNLAFALSAGVTNPGDVILPLRYYKRDIVTPQVEMSPEGMISLPDGPGIGFKVDEDAIAEVTTGRWTVTTA